MASGNSQSKHTSPSNNRKSEAKKSEKKSLPLLSFFHPLHKALERNELCRAFSFALFLFYIFGYKPNKNKQEKRSHLDLQGNTQETQNI